MADNYALHPTEPQT
jgi:MFS family permease